MEKVTQTEMELRAQLSAMERERDVYKAEHAHMQELHAAAEARVAEARRLCELVADARAAESRYGVNEAVESICEYVDRWRSASPVVTEPPTTEETEK